MVNPMDPHDITDYQVREAAIELCRLQGVDPHARVYADSPHQLGGGAPKMCEHWENLAPVVRLWVNVMRSINTVARRYNEHDKEA